MYLCTQWNLFLVRGMSLFQGLFNTCLFNTCTTHFCTLRLHNSGCCYFRGACGSTPYSLAELEWLGTILLNQEIATTKHCMFTLSVQPRQDGKLQVSSWHYRRSPLSRESRRPPWDVFNLFNTAGMVVMRTTVTPLLTLKIAVCVWEFYVCTFEREDAPLCVIYTDDRTHHEQHACWPCKVNP